MVFVVVVLAVVIIG